MTNYIRRPASWASVDWEYSGWGDPAFDVANLMAHVAYMESPSMPSNLVRDTHSGLVEDASAFLRIRTYCDILLVWWAARLARYLYELPRGRDQRLPDWPAGWQADLEAKYDHYLGLAEVVCAQRPQWDPQAAQAAQLGYWVSDIGNRILDMLLDTTHNGDLTLTIRFMLKGRGS